MKNLLYTYIHQTDCPSEALTNKGGGGVYPPAVENQISKGFPFFYEEKTGNWTKHWGENGKQFGNKPNYFPFSRFPPLKASLNCS
jgi:hypothetical protein